MHYCSWSKRNDFFVNILRRSKYLGPDKICVQLVCNPLCLCSRSAGRCTKKTISNMCMGTYDLRQSTRDMQAPGKHGLHFVFSWDKPFFGRKIPTQ